MAGARQRLPDRGGGRARPRARPRAVRPPPRRGRRRRARARARPTSPATSRGCGSSTRTARRPSCRATARARRCSTCARAAGRTRATYSIQTLAGEIRATITGEHSCRTDMGRATLSGEGELEGRRYQHIVIGNPQTAIRVAERERARGARPGRDRAADRARRDLPEPHQRLVLDRARARPHPRPDLRARGGGDAVLGHRRLRRRGRARAARRRLAGHRRARRRRAEVDVDESLHVDLEGWAVPVFTGEVSVACSRR